MIYRAVLMLLLTSGQLYAQMKYEKESRLHPDEVPHSAFQFVDSLQDIKKVRWYLEEGFDRKSIEAKFKADKLKYSVEFDSEGTLEDIEVLRDWEELNESLRTSVLDKLCEDCWKIRILKVQFQYTGQPSDLWKFTASGQNIEKLTLRYEIVIRCRTMNNTVQYEYLYSDTGEKLSRSEIVLNNASNLEY